MLFFLLILSCAVLCGAEGPVPEDASQRAAHKTLVSPELEKDLRGCALTVWYREERVLWEVRFSKETFAACPKSSFSDRLGVDNVGDFLYAMAVVGSKRSNICIGARSVFAFPHVQNLMNVLRNIPADNVVAYAVSSDGLRVLHEAFQKKPMDFGISCASEPLTFGTPGARATGNTTYDSLWDSFCVAGLWDFVVPFSLTRLPKGCLALTVPGQNFQFVGWCGENGLQALAQGVFQQVKKIFPGGSLS